ncbi:MAG: type II toxin-antitoxin system PemK/MazF family toxin [Desulfovibrionaceae bacterium]
MVADQPKRFEVHWVCLDPTVGSEMQKTRPAVIVSPDELNQSLRTVLVAPLTSTLRPWPFRPQLTIKGRAGQVCLDQLRTLDKQRLVGRMGRLTRPQQALVLKTLSEMFAP